MKDRKEYLFCGYNCPIDGYYTVNGYTYFFGEDFRSAKRYKEYLDCGFNVVQARGKNSYNGEEWETCQCRRVFDEALKAGCEKILVTDARFDRWINKEKNLIGEERMFADEAALDKAVAECVAPYCDRKGFYGIQLLDEPTYSDFPAYAQLVRSLQRVLPDVYLQCNLLPLGAPFERLVPSDEKACSDPALKMATEQAGMQEIYEKYVSDFTDMTGLDSILFDEYPFRREYIISGNTLPNYQLVARICQKRGIEFRVVLQSFSMVWNGILHNRKMTESDMYWQTNLALGFGVREFSFYTYLAKPDLTYKDGAFGEIDGGAFINLDGSKTALYFYTKRIIAEMKKFSPTALKYRYQSSHIVTEKEKTRNDYEWTRYLYEDEKCPIPVSVDKGVLLVTRQTDGENELYMFENIGNVKDELFDGALPMKLTVKLPAGKKKFFFRGKKTKPLFSEENGCGFSLKVGDAVFAEIIK
ncbi:MAG: hypothetical protein ACI4RO_05520 [Candidatus Scatosoma sp.]